MAIEFERKFLVQENVLNEVTAKAVGKLDIAQGYYMEAGSKLARIRASNSQWFLTFKEKLPELGKNVEIEFELRKSDQENALLMLEMCEHKISKTRYCIPLVDDLVIELDVFSGKFQGLVLAEVELKSEDDSKKLDAHLPNWFRREVTQFKQYSNMALAKAGCIPAEPA